MRGYCVSVCRLLGYVAADADLSLLGVIGEDAAAEFCKISRIHNDGWGASFVSNSKRAAHVADGGAPSPELYDSVYRSTEPAFLDDNFTTIARTPSRSAIFHLRLASSNLPLIPANQQPFTAHGISFAHNGDISSDDGINVVNNPHVRVSQAEIARSGGESDSAIYFAHILHFVDKALSLEKSVEQAIATLREQYPDSSYNCLVQSDNQLICVNATGYDRLAHRVAQVYDSYGMLEKAADYRVIRYKKLENSGVVVASSGFHQRKEDGWTQLPNNHILVADQATGEFEIRPLDVHNCEHE